MLREFDIERLVEEVNGKGIATKIVDLLDKMFTDAKETSYRRWIWELIQNAVDVRCANVPVRICIELDENEGVVYFRHNGKPFTDKAMFSLIHQVSSKDRTKDSGTTGKFGTGFITTHLLSRIVQINSLVETSEGEFVPINVILDRTSTELDTTLENTKTSRMKFIHEYENNQGIHYNEGDMVTTFSYKLDNEKSLETAKIGIEDFKRNVSYVMCYVPQIECIELVGYGTFYRAQQQHLKGNLSEYTIPVQLQDDEQTEITHLVVNDEQDNLQIAIQLEQNKVVSLIDMDKAFCTFPLLGTDTLQIPYVINCKHFEVNEPRDGILLSSPQEVKVVENLRLLDKTVSMYQEIIEYLNVTTLFDIEKKYGHSTLHGTSELQIFPNRNGQVCELRDLIVVENISELAYQLILWTNSDVGKYIIHDDYKWVTALYDIEQQSVEKCLENLSYLKDTRDGMLLLNATLRNDTIKNLVLESLQLECVNRYSTLLINNMTDKMYSFSSFAIASKFILDELEQNFDSYGAEIELLIPYIRSSFLNVVRENLRRSADHVINSEMKPEDLQTLYNVLYEKGFHLDRQYQGSYYQYTVYNIFTNQFVLASSDKIRLLDSTVPPFIREALGVLGQSLQNEVVCTSLNPNLAFLSTMSYQDTISKIADKCRCLVEIDSENRDEDEATTATAIFAWIMKHNDSIADQPSLKEFIDQQYKFCTQTQLATWMSKAMKMEDILAEHGISINDLDDFLLYGENEQIGRVAEVFYRKQRRKPISSDVG
ncbi:MAG: hypothetical protein ATN35_06055 [Epulopiscium sp. Nele67-Bin004]|nr:MAG: hypothetical protein ATN35_06055 [Epulopiscium sp. Nele67-Bin004]